MAQIVISFPDPIAARVYGAMAARHLYPTTIPDPANPSGNQITNPETEAQFTARILRTSLLEAVKWHEATGPEAAVILRAEALASVATDIVIT